ncbi:TRAP transporter permease [Consotaella salsifontis]|uniref:TRAP transporter, 4TM/12TM fusion protein n=1 Tax=Consotaella salsifontis TaxID=1365950 RepID=A0A1T4S2J5_9HYPH|nr:TRAP transporter fused permease subunit [Consotaella salsifontis]SKA22455.1 TRAP transporter, 4TM/12TM fusion protein [Consotaella salsifontis]
MLRNFRIEYLYRISWILALIASLYHLSMVYFGLPEAFKLRTTHLMLLLPIAFLINPVYRKGRSRVYALFDAFFFFSALGTTFFLGWLDYDTIIARIPQIDELTTTQVIVGVLLLVTVLEATRRIVGWSMVWVCVVAIGYALFGHLVPRPFAYSGSSFKEVLDQLVFTTEGVFGIPLAASATFIFLFILFGKFLERSGAGAFFMDLSYALAGRTRGGPAKVAVLASGFIGSISGSATANVASTGAYTIPLMRKAKYPPEFAGAVEAAASTGGQLLPPIMGAASFLMAEFIGIPYTSLIVAAAVPAILFFLSVGASVHFETVRLGLLTPSEIDIPNGRTLLKRAHLIVPLFVVVIIMFQGYTPYMSAVIAIGSVLVVSSILAATRMSFKDIVATLADGAKDAVLITVTTAAAGIVIGVASETGIGVRFASMVVSLAAGNLYLLLVLIMIASLILGMGLPTSAAYIMVAAIAIPGMIDAGIFPLSAHLFALYFGVFSAVTPPVAITAYAAAGLAKANPMTTGVKAFQLSIPAFIIPYAFVAHPEMLLEGSLVDVLWVIALAIPGVIAFSSAATGFFSCRLSIVERLLMLAGSLGLLLSTSTPLTLAALLAVAGVAAFQMLRTRSRALAELKGSPHEN